MFTVSRLVRINQVVRCKVIRETRFNDLAPNLTPLKNSKMKPAMFYS